MYLVVGLGNYEPQYLNTYHNLGFMVADMLAENLGVSFGKTKCKAEIAETVINGEKVIIAKPLTFMNHSGQSVSEFVRMFKIPLQNVIVAYDDIDIEKGTLRLKKDGSAGTHNGMRSVVEWLGTDKFARVRIGAGRPERKEMLADYVLSKIDNKSKEQIMPALTRATEVIKSYIVNNGNIQNVNK